jgi:hypothetical protein
MIVAMADYFDFDTGRMRRLLEGSRQLHPSRPSLD